MASRAMPGINPQKLRTDAKAKRLSSLSSLLRHHWRRASASSFTFLRGQCYAAAATANPLCKLIFGHIKTFVHHVREGKLQPEWQ